MAQTYQFETLEVQRNAEDPRVLEVALNRPEKLNAMNNQLFMELKQCLSTASTDPDVHCVLLHGGRARMFTCGLDLQSELAGGDGGGLLGGAEGGKLDVSRRALRMEKGISEYQAAISSLEGCCKPVVVALHSGVIGGGIDLACAADIRYCTEDTFFCIAEVNIGICADIGTLQRLPKIVGNDSTVRELALTGRKMKSAEAKNLGLVGEVFPDLAACVAASRKVCLEIASKSPIGVIGTKASLNYSRDHTVQEGLDHVRLWNVLHLQSEDVKRAVTATLSKKTPTFSRL